MPLQLAPLHSHDPAFQLPVSGSVTIGRRPNNTLVCNDISVSGKHCEISIASGSVKISDCSTNGTYINDERIVKGEVAEVSPGDVIALTKPHPPGALDSTVEAAVRVQFRLEHGHATGALSDANGDGNLTSTALRGEAAATFSQSCPPNPPKRAATTAEGFAHDLLMQEQQCKAKITGELLLARRRLDEERSKSDSLARDLRKAKATLEEERRRKSAALDGREALKAEAAKLKDNRHQLPEMRSTQTSLQQKHEALEIEVTTFAQKASSLEMAVSRLREELGDLAPASSGALESAQESFRQAQDEANSLEKQVSELQQKAELAQKAVEKSQQDLNAERTRKERLEDQQALLASEVERAEKNGSQAEELLAKAKQEIQSLEERVSRHRGEAEQQREISSEKRRLQQLQMQSAEQMREACGRFAEALQGCTEKWLNALPEGEAAMAPPPAPAVPTKAVKVQKVPAAPEAPPAPLATSRGANGVIAEVVDSGQQSQEQSSQPSQPPPLPPPESPPEGAGPAAPPQRLWSVAVLGGTAMEGDSLGLLLEGSPKRRKVSAH